MLASTDFLPAAKMTQVLVEKDEEAQEEKEEEIEEEKEEEEEEEKIDPNSFIAKISLMLSTGNYDPDDINLRRKHPNLGKKIGEIIHRLVKAEKTIENLKKYLEPEIKKNFKKELDYWFDRECKIMLDNL